MKVLLLKLSRNKFLVFIVGLFLFLGALVILLNVLLSSPVTPDKKKDIVLQIPSNTNADKIANMLYQQGLIKQPWIFSIYARYSGADSQLKAGEYILNNGQSIPEIVQTLIRGPLNVFSITIPEGYTVQQVADLLVKKGLTDSASFYETVAYEDFPYPFLRELAAGEHRLEGYLFPDTYHVGSNSDSKLIVDMMLKRFDGVINELNYVQKAEAMGLTLHEAVTIASMIEREAKYDSERSLIAGVIYNRLNLGMPLQIDATVQYALGTNRSKLYYKDLETESPYNTYKVNGLPPGPIASPGRASLIAAVNPQKTDYLYYVAKPDGTHIFAETLSEHNQNKMKYIR
ncbi:endolytic transglycosylase MltG [Desulfolucanica intricata]|uniref:endolytic transglycosylase MltG n=1 Tax=Desulfolucanica intricata TaxID=1285191 RepID=UPI00082B44C8|nr:endolytic transglycosylase MltG [Desulfolucanica intricata]